MNSLTEETQLLPLLVQKRLDCFNRLVSAYVDEIHSNIINSQADITVQSQCKMFVSECAEYVKTKMVEDTLTEKKIAHIPNSDKLPGKYRVDWINDMLYGDSDWCGYEDSLNDTMESVGLFIEKHILSGVVVMRIFERKPAWTVTRNGSRKKV